MDLMANIAQFNGGTTALSGILVVFAGLILIALCIVLFNFLLMEREKPAEALAAESAGDVGRQQKASADTTGAESEPIPEEDLVVLATLIELYRRVHFDALQSDITFVRGQDAANSWQMGYKYGQRHRI